LKRLNLGGNTYLTILEPNSFSGLQLFELKLKHTKITTLIARTFAGLQVKTLDISNNQIQTIAGYAFENLKVENLLINEVSIETFDRNIFYGIEGLELLQTPAYRFCCVRPFNFPEEKCYPEKDEFSSCADLIESRTLQILLWAMGLLSIVGNILSLVYRIRYDSQRLKLGYGIFVTNLAVADFLMGIYLMTIAVADIIFRDRFGLLVHRRLFYLISFRSFDILTLTIPFTDLVLRRLEINNISIFF
jgi:hypothetical protein